MAPRLPLAAKGDYLEIILEEFQTALVKNCGFIGGFICGFIGFKPIEICDEAFASMKLFGVPMTPLFFYLEFFLELEFFLFRDRLFYF